MEIHQHKSKHISSSGSKVRRQIHKMGVGSYRQDLVQNTTIWLCPSPSKADVQTANLDGGENNMQQRREYRALHQLFQDNQTTHKHSITAQTNSQRHALEQDSPPSPDNTDPSTARDAHPYSTCCCIEYVRRKHTNAALLDAAAISKFEAFRNKQQTMLVLLLRSCRRNQALPEDNNQGKNNFNEPSRPKITAPANGGGTAVQPHPHWLRHQPRAPWVLGGGTK